MAFTPTTRKTSAKRTEQAAGKQAAMIEITTAAALAAMSRTSMKLVLPSAAFLSKPMSFRLYCPTAVEANVSATVFMPSAAAPTWFDELEKRLDNPGDIARIMAALERRGYMVRKATATTTAAPKSSIAMLADSLVESVPVTAITEAAKKAAAKAAAK